MANNKDKRSQFPSTGLVPVQRNQQVINPKAVAAHHQVTNQQAIERKNRNPRGTKFETYRRAGKAGGVHASDYVKFDPKEGIKGVRTHDLAWDRGVNRRPGGTEFQAPTRGGVGRQVSTQQMGAMVGQSLDQIPIGDRITGEFYTGDGQQGRRGSYFGRETNGLLKPNDKGAFGAKRVGPTTWLRDDGVKIHFDPKQPTKDLARMGVSRVARTIGGPMMQGIMTLNDAVHAMTGKGLLDHRRDGQDKVAKHMGWD